MQGARLERIREGLVAQLGLSYTLLGSTVFGVSYSRDLTYSYDELQPFFVDALPDLPPWVLRLRLSMLGTAALLTLAGDNRGEHRRVERQALAGLCAELQAQDVVRKTHRRVSS